MRDEGGALEDFLRRVHERDSHELEEARRRAQGLVRVEDHEGWLRLETMSSGLEGSQDIKDLLMYLSHAISHFGSAHRRTEDGRLVHPLLAWENGWHVSWQTGWLKREQDVWSEMD